MHDAPSYPSDVPSLPYRYLQSALKLHLACVCTASGSSIGQMIEPGSVAGTHTRYLVLPKPQGEGTEGQSGYEAARVVNALDIVLLMPDKTRALLQRHHRL